MELRQDLSALPFYQLLRLARQGDVDAQFEVACHYDFDPPKRKKLALKWYRLAADQGHAEAEDLLGESYRDGDGVPCNCRMAVRWFSRAAQHGDSDAQVSLGYSYFHGEGVSKNYSKAIHWYRRSARQKNDSISSTSGCVISTGMGSSRMQRSPCNGSKKPRHRAMCGHSSR